MKKLYYGFGCLVLSALLVACSSNGNTKKQSETSSSSAKVAETTKKESTTSAVTSLSSSSSTSVSTTEAQTSQAAVPQMESQGMNLEQIAGGDFSSIAGIWKDGTGKEMTFDASGYVGENTVTRVSADGLKDGILTFGVNSKDGVGGFAISLIPAGKVAPLGADNKEDSSDFTKDRIIAGHQYIVSYPENFFYKVK